jgi:hypothetical protein
MGTAVDSAADIGTAGRHNNLAATTEGGADVPASSRNDRMTAVADRGSRSRTAGNYLQKAAAIYGRTEVPAADDDLGAATGDYCRSSFPQTEPLRLRR